MFKLHISVCSIYAKVVLCACALSMVLCYYVVEVVGKHRFIYIYIRAVPYLCLIRLSQVPLMCF
jgi:hypothetical protein